MRILIATVTAGAGHLQAAAALEEAWKYFRPGDTVKKVDVLDFTPGIFRKAYADGYVSLVRRSPELYGAVFRKTDDAAWIGKVTRLKRAFARYSAPGFARLVGDFRPHAVLATHFLPLEILGGLKSRGAWFPRISCVVTDFEAHALWMEPCVDEYFVAAQETADRLLARGVPEEALAVTGIPVSRRFSLPIDRRAVRKRMGLRDDLPTLLLLSGGFGMGPVAQTLAALDRLKTPVQTIVVAGRNAELRRELAGQDRAHPTTVLGFTSDMHELMAVSELIVTKPGGMTSSEALAMGKPLMILDPIPGQETANSDFLLERGAAAKVNRTEELPARLDRLLGSRRLAAMARSAKALGRPGAALDICRRVRAKIARVSVAAALFALALPACAEPLALHELDKAAQSAFIVQDAAAVARYRQGLESVVEFCDSRPDLFPKEKLREKRLLAREQKEAVWGAWQRFLDVMLALDSLGNRYGTFWRLSGQRREAALAARYAAFLAQYRWAVELIERVEKDPGLDTILNEPVPELGLPAGTYARLKFRYLNVLLAAEFAAMEAVYKAAGPTDDGPLSASIRSDADYVWKLGRGKGEALTARNALKILKRTGHKGFMPVQSGLAEWMGDVRLRRKDRTLISPAQIEAMPKTFQPGDVMVQRREWFLSNAGIPGFWTHAALYVGTPEERRRFFDEAGAKDWVRAQGRADGDFEGLLRERFPAKYELQLKPQEDGHRVRVIEGISEGVSFTTIEHSAAADSIGVLRPILAKPDKARAILRAFQFQGRPYDYNFDFATDSEIVCSELVYKVYEASAGASGLHLPLVEVMGRMISPPNDFVRQFDAQLGTLSQQFDLVLFLDGREREKRSAPGDVKEFRSSWRRPKWHILVQ